MYVEGTICLYIILIGGDMVQQSGQCVEELLLNSSQARAVKSDDDSCTVPGDSTHTDELKHSKLKSGDDEVSVIS